MVRTVPIDFGLERGVHISGDREIGCFFTFMSLDNDGRKEDIYLRLFIHFSYLILDIFCLY